MSTTTAKRNASMPSDGGKRTFSGANMSTNQKVNGSTGQKIKNFFRISGHGKGDGSQTQSETGSLDKAVRDEGTRTPQSQNDKDKKSLRNSRFLPHIGRARSTTVASEGNALDDGMSPTAHVNPYFQHQGPPALRHHNDSSVPPSPPDTPQTPKKLGEPPVPKDATSGREELARKLRRVASAPNAQGLFSKSKSKGSADSSGSRPATAQTEEGIQMNGKLGTHGNASALSMVETVPQGDDLLPVPGLVDGKLSPGKIRNSVAFRRTYSSNSIKVRTVEVGPSSFDKIKLIGKGDVGKVYLVREKKSSRLYAMKGESTTHELLQRDANTIASAIEERDDQAEQDQARSRRTGNPRHIEPSIHCYAISLIPVGGPSLPVHGVLQRRRVFPSAADQAEQVRGRGRCEILCS